MRCWDTAGKVAPAGAQPPRMHTSVGRRSTRLPTQHACLQQESQPSVRLAHQGALPRKGLCRWAALQSAPPHRTGSAPLQCRQGAHRWLPPQASHRSPLSISSAPELGREPERKQLLSCNLATDSQRHWAQDALPRLSTLYGNSEYESGLWLKRMAAMQVRQQPCRCQPFQKEADVTGGCWKGW